MASTISLMVGTTSPAVSDIISFVDAANPDGTPVDLTNCDVKFQMRLLSSDELKVDETATIIDADSGEVQYLWQAADTDTAGVYAAWFRVTFDDNSIQDTPEFSVRIKTHAPIVGGYTTVAAVRDYLSKDLNDSAQDELIADLIVRYSAAVDDFCQVGFGSETADDGVTKRFRFFGRVVSLGKYGLDSVDSVVLSPEDGGTELVENVDYVLLPLNKDNGTYTSIELSSWLVTSQSTMWRLGMAFIDVTGSWGTTSVPPVIEYAVVRAVSGAIRRDVAFYTNSFSENDAGAPPVFLSADVRAALQPYRRYGY